MFAYTIMGVLSGPLVASYVAINYLEYSVKELIVFEPLLVTSLSGLVVCTVLGFMTDNLIQQGLAKEKDGDINNWQQFADTLSY